MRILSAKNSEHLSSELYQERHYRELKLADAEMRKTNFNTQRKGLCDVDVQAIMAFLGKYILSLREVGKMCVESTLQTWTCTVAKLATNSQSLLQ